MQSTSLEAGFVPPRQR